MRNFKIKRIFALCCLLSLVACGPKKTEHATGTEVYACNSIGHEMQQGRDVEHFACFDTKTFEVCNVVADSETGARLASSCRGYR